MPRAKIMSDADVLQIALDLMRRSSPDALTFGSLAKACGLSGATLVQRFGSKQALLKATLLQAWDQLDAMTAQAVHDAPKSAGGVVQILVALSGDYGDIDLYADGLLILREDLRDPDLRQRGRAWGDVLARAIDDCLRDMPGLPEGFGPLVLAHWQGTLLWWSFDPTDRVDLHVKDSLTVFLNAFLKQA